MTNPAPTHGPERISAASLNATRRTRDLERLAANPDVDVLVIGGGITGVGVALDAATRGMSVVLAERRDLAYGTSRFSSKLAHGGLRYLAHAQFGVASESALERHILATRTAPHLIHPYVQVVPLTPQVDYPHAALQRMGLGLGDLLRLAAKTPSGYLGWTHRISPAATRVAIPCVNPDGLRGGLRSFDCQMIDDARIVVAMARTAAAHGATILTRVAVSDAAGDGALLTDQLGGGSLRVRARAVINATGVWAADLDPTIRLRPSRGTHLVFSQRRFGDLGAGFMVPVPGSISRFVFALPADLDRVYLGLTDVEAPGDIPDVAAPSAEEIQFLLDVVNPSMDRPLGRDDIIGAFAGLRPLLDSGEGQTADVSRKHAIIAADNGLLTIVGGKFTTYRRMAEDVLDRAIADRGLAAGECRTRRLALMGAAPRAELAAIDAPRFGRDTRVAPMVARYGADALHILELAQGRPGWLEPVAPGLSVTRAELEFGTRHELALFPEDLLDRRTRIGLVDTDRAAVAELAAEVAPLTSVALDAGEDRTSGSFSEPSADYVRS